MRDDVPCAMILWQFAQISAFLSWSEVLRQENTALMEQVISYKERQMGFLQDVESLKQEKAALVAEKVRRYVCMIYTPRPHT